MKGRKVFIYSNVPLTRSGDVYYAQTKMFMEFVRVLSECDEKYGLIIPCMESDGNCEAELARIELKREKVIEECMYYDSDSGAFVKSFMNAIKLSRKLREQAENNEVMLMGPTNTFMFWMSLFCGKRIKYGFFARGDAVESLECIYRGGVGYYPAMAVAKTVRKRIMRLLKRKMAVVFTFGEKLKRIFADGENEVHVIRPLIEEKFIRKDERPKIGEDGPLNILYVGRFSEEKNVMALVNACVAACEKGRKARLRLVGFGPQETNIIETIESCGAADYIEIVGFVPYGEALVKEYDSSDVLCLPSLSEGTPGVVVEAFARGMPVLSTRVGSVPDMFPEEIKYIEGFEKKGVLEGIEWCAGNRAELSGLGRRGRAKVEEFLISRNVDRINDVVHSFMKWKD